MPGVSGVTAALAVYTVAALGLDQVTTGVHALTSSPVALVVAASVEEGGEGLAAVPVVPAWGPRR